MSQFENNLLYAEKFCPVMQNYMHIFAKIFHYELISFGYERWINDKNTGEKNFIGTFSLPQQNELFLQTNAYKELGLINANIPELDKKIDLLTTDFCNTSSNYYAFRLQMQNKFNICISLVTQEQCFNYNQFFIWNFALPTKVDLIIKNNILMDYLNKLTVITQCLHRFKVQHSQQICQELPTVSFPINESIKQPNHQDEILKRKNQVISMLINDGILSNNDLELKTLQFSQSIIDCLHYYYITQWSIANIAQYLNITEQSVRENLDYIKIVLNVKTDHEVYNKVRKIELWKTII